MSVDYQFSIASAVRAMISADADGYEHHEAKEAKTPPPRFIHAPRSFVGKLRARREYKIVRDWHLRPRSGNSGRAPKPIQSLDGKLHFPSLTDMAYAFACAPSAISQSMSDGHEFAGRRWEYVR